MYELGVLAYGSLWDEPGAELEDATKERLDPVPTPFSVEYARSSRTRGGAPTLVPVAVGGSPVYARVLVMKDGIDLSEARNRTYRREIRRIGSGAQYVHRSEPRPGHVWLPVTDQLDDIAKAIYTVLEANIASAERSGHSLATMAIRSVRSAKPNMDGISYLENNLAKRITTPLTEEYVAAILEITGTDSLAAARARSRER